MLSASGLRRVRVLACLLTAAVLAPNARSQSATNELSVNAQKVAHACRGADDDIFGLVLRLRVEACNTTQGRLIVATAPESLTPNVAASIEKGQAEEFEFEFDCVLRFPTVANKKFGKAPDRKRFAFLDPGACLATEIDTEVLVRSTGADERTLPGTVLEGTRHAIQAWLDWEWIFYGLPEADRDAIRKRWEPYGRLFRGTTPTSWIEFTAPSWEDLRDCPAKAGASRQSSK